MPDRTPHDRQFLTAEHLADRWEIPVSQVYNLTRAGEIPHVRLGRYYRYKLAAIEAWEDQAPPIQEAA